MKNPNGLDTDLQIPEVLPVIPVRDVTVFPFIIFPLSVTRDRDLNGVEVALSSHRLVLLVGQSDGNEENPEEKDLYRVGTVATVMRMLKLPDGRMRILIQGISRAKVEYFTMQDPYREAKLQVLSGAFAGRELELTKALTTLGRPGVQVAAITRRAEGYYIVHVESGKEDDYPLVNGRPIGAQARKLTDNDVVQLAGVKMGFFAS